MCIIQTVLKLISPVPKVEKYQKYLFVSPHPDDIEVACGSTVARLVAEGKEVSFLICTDGRYGTEDENMNPDDLVEIRKKEVYASAAVLGVKDITFLPFKDGGMYTETELRVEIMKVISRVQPDVVLAPDYQLINECHADHVLTGRAATHAYMCCGNYHMMQDFGCGQIAKPEVLAYFYTDKPNTYVKTGGKYFKKFIEALSCYKSQFKIENDDGSFKGLLLYQKVRTFKYGIRKLSTHADGFRALANLHMHCAPEAAKL